MSIRTSGGGAPTWAQVGSGGPHGDADVVVRADQHVRGLLQQDGSSGTTWPVSAAWARWFSPMRGIWCGRGVGRRPDRSRTWLPGRRPVHRRHVIRDGEVALSVHNQIQGRHRQIRRYLSTSVEPGRQGARRSGALPEGHALAGSQAVYILVNVATMAGMSMEGSSSHWICRPSMTASNSRAIWSAGSSVRT